MLCNLMEAHKGASARHDRNLHITIKQKNLTYLRHRQSHCHGNTDKEGRQEDLREEALCVSFGTVEPLDDETMELTQL